MARRRVRWQNFRSFVDTGPIDLEPLTVVIGSNSSGKTSLHLPLLLLKQTTDARDESIGLVTRGALANVGSYSDLIYRHDVRKELVLEIGFNEREPAVPKKERQENPAPAEASMWFDVDREARETRLRQYEIRDVYGSVRLRRTRREGGTFSLEGVSLGRSDLASSIRRQQPTHFLFSSFGPLSQAIQGARGEEFEIPARVTQYIAVTGYTQSNLEGLLEGISFVGPLRERPRRRYELSEEMPAHVGTSGQAAPEILFRNQETPLLESVEKWLNEFGAGSGITFSESENTFSIQIKPQTREPTVNLADLGFGVSQVLPLIVQGFAATEGSTLIAEQPEIHLNPRYQALLANLFCEVSNRGVTTIIETHSEHLLLRLRRLIADEAISADDVGLYFVEKRRGRSEVHRVPIQQNGHIDPAEWPEGFFAEPLHDAVALVESQRKRRQPSAPERLHNA